MTIRLFLSCLFLYISLTQLVLSQSASQPTVLPGSREVEVTFPSGKVVLAGTLLIPERVEPVPAIILVPGSRSGSPRSLMKGFADRFVLNGLATFIFDKRGSGASSGSWTEASLDDLADDAIAAAAFLQSRRDIDPKRIGIWGVSQAGWVIPHAIARSPGTFAFAVVVTGGGVKAVEVERYDYETALQHIGATVEERREAMALVERYFDYVKRGEGRAELESAISAVAAKSWIKAVNLSRVMPSDAARSKWEWVVNYEPESDISKVNIPVLVVFGGRDRPGLVEEAEERWRRALMKARNSNATLLFFVDAGHGITIGEHHAGTGPMKYASGYLEILDSWLRVQSAPQ